MSFKYKIDVMAALKARGYTTYSIRNKKILADSTVTKIRKGEMPSWSYLDLICDLLGCQPGDIIMHVPNDPLRHGTKKVVKDK